MRSFSFSGEPLARAKRTITHRSRSDVMHLEAGATQSDPLHNQGTGNYVKAIRTHWVKTGVDPGKLNERTHGYLKAVFTRTQAGRPLVGATEIDLGTSLMTMVYSLVPILACSMLTCVKRRVEPVTPQ